MSILRHLSLFSLLIVSTLCFRNIRLDTLTKCPEHKNAPVYLEEVYFVPVQRKIMISAKMIAKEDTGKERDFILNVKLQKCNSKEMLDTCEPGQELHVKKICDLIGQKHQLWSPLIQQFYPPIQCPLLKGTYVSKNGSIDASFFTAFPMDWYWKATAIVGNGSAVAMCVLAGGQIAEF